ncbi:MAG: hypothetical protein ISR69_12220 [Gammaproteobacteria bacterium]|nr:hypothetical protein [Gammaproteobacteria bacterium]
MFNSLSINTVNFLYNASNFILILGAVLVAIGTYGSIQMSSIKESFNKVEFERAKEKTNDAHILISTLEDKQRPRVISNNVISKIIEEASKAPEKDTVQISCVIDDPEAWALATQIYEAFKSAGFKLERILPTITTPPIHGVKIQSSDLSPNHIHVSMILLMQGLNLPLEAEQLKDNKSGKWRINIGKKHETTKTSYPLCLI